MKAEDFGKSRDHPHACGDKPLAQMLSRVQEGSSPRVWGQVLDAITMVSFIGIIPTRVGTRLSLVVLFVLSLDHPHACGDKQIRFAGETLSAGSSPRVWGQGIF